MSLEPFKLLIVNADGQYYARELARRLPGLAFDWCPPGEPVPPEARDATALACFASALNGDLLASLPRLRWLQALSSGVDGILGHPGLPPGTVLTSAHGIHGPAVSEMALALMLVLARDFAAILADQSARRWRRRRQPLLHGKTVAVLGTGLIASELAHKCRALGMHTLALSGKPRAVPGFDQVYAREALPMTRYGQYRACWSHRISRANRIATQTRYCRSLPTMQAPGRPAI